MSFRSVEDAKTYLKDHGYVALREKSYKAAQRRQEQAQSDLLWVERQLASEHAWALDGHNEAQRLRDRLTFVYGVAKAKGATDEELRGCEQCRAASLGGDDQKETT